MAKHNSSSEEKDIRVALKMPSRAGADTHKVANVVSKIRQALRNSSSGSSKGGVSRRNRGGMASSSVKGAAAGPKPLQRVAVRWTYSANKGDGQWGAHGKYIERESAGKEQDLDKGQELDADRDLEDPLTPGKDAQHEREPSGSRDGRDHQFANYDGANPLGDERHVSALRKSHAAAIGQAPQAKSLNSMRTLSSIGVVQWKGRGEVLLQGDAHDRVEQRGTARDGLMRRGGGSEPGAGGNDGRIGRRSVGALGFGSEGDAVSISKTLASWQKGGDELMHKLIVSPEFGHKIDLRKQVKEMMAQMELDLGTKLQWVAVEHFNTDNPHVHIAVRGVDDKGQKLEVAPIYIKEGARQRAQEAATRQLGYRTERDVDEALERQITQQRFTDIDRGLLRAANTQGTPNLDYALVRDARKQTGDRLEIDFKATKMPASAKARAVRLAQIEYLVQLESRGLAQRVGEMRWKLSPTLGTPQGRSDAARANPAGEILVEHGSAPYQFDEKNKDNYFAKLRSPTGEERVVWGVDIERSLSAADAEIGDYVDLSRGGKVLVKVDVKDPETGVVSVKEVERVEWITKKRDPPPAVAAGIDPAKPAAQQLLISFEGGVPPGEQARALRLKQIKRLVELQKMGLAERVGNMSWKLNPSLETALRQIQSSQDRLKLKYQHRAQISDPSATLVSTELKTVGQRVAGRLVGTGLDEASNRPYMMVEAFDGKVHYVNQTPKIQQMRGEGLKMGDYVALEVVQLSGKAGGFIKVDHYGPTVPVDAIDKELLAGGKPVERITTQKTVAGAFLAAAAERQEKLIHAGAIEVVDGKLAVKSGIALDLVHLEDKGIKAEVAQINAVIVGQVLGKTKDSVLVETKTGDKLVLPAERLQEMGLESKFIGKDAAIVIAPMAGKPLSTEATKQVGEKLLAHGPANYQFDEKKALNYFARLEAPDGSIRTVWGVDIKRSIAQAEVDVGDRVDINRGGKKLVTITEEDPETGKPVSKEVERIEWITNKLPDLAPELPVAKYQAFALNMDKLDDLVNDGRANRLDTVIQAGQEHVSGKLATAVEQRVKVWQERGVDPMSPDFRRDAGAWRKSNELHQAAIEKGAEPVIEQLGRDRGKPTREMTCEPGRQVSGRVILVHKAADVTTVVVDSGRELTVLRQPAPAEVDVQAGQRIRARPDLESERQRMALWRFADLEREEAREKGRPGKQF